MLGAFLGVPDGRELVSDRLALHLQCARTDIGDRDSYRVRSTDEEACVVSHANEDNRKVEVVVACDGIGGFVRPAYSERPMMVLDLGA